eukprot:SM000030S11329  [mRNA]  locus=s30:95988:98609:- [translate_table: standard]
MRPFSVLAYKRGLVRKSTDHSVLARRAAVVVPSDDAVVIRLGSQPGSATEITINCPDRVGLGCDLARIVYEFDLSVVRGGMDGMSSMPHQPRIQLGASQVASLSFADLSTDGRWCFLVFWVLPQSGSANSVKWSLLKQRITAACPSNNPVLIYLPKPEPRTRELFLFQVCSSNRSGLLNDVCQVLWEIELTIKRVNVTTSPDDKAVDLFFVIDNRYKCLHLSMVEIEYKGELPAKHRAEEVCSRVQEALGLGDPSTRCELSAAGALAQDCALALVMPPSVEHSLFLEKEHGSDYDELEPGEKVVSPVPVTLDNGLSPAHSVIQIVARERKGLLYDCLRSLKDVHLQVAFGRTMSNEHSMCDMDMFVQQMDGRKVVDPTRQKEVCRAVKRALEKPIRIVVVTKGPDSELIVATPVEKCGRGRPRVLFDVSYVLRMLEFQADITRHTVKDREWEIYRLLVQDKAGQAILSSKARTLVADEVRKALMG